jgi:hypothetical protein
MDFSFKPKLSKDFILSQLSEEQIMEFYLNIPVKTGLFRSPLRPDNHPTCSFYRNKSGYLIFKDFATGQHLNVFSIVQEVCHCTYNEAIKIIANDFHLIQCDNLKRNTGRIATTINKITNKEFTKIQVEIQDFQPHEIKWWNKHGVSLETLKLYNVFSCKHLFLNNQLVAQSQKTCPIYGYYGGTMKQNEDNLELWRCYFPKRKSYRFITNWPSNRIQGLKQLPKQGKILVITKSMKDVMCLHDLGISAIAPCSENLFIPDNILYKLRQIYKYIIVFYDSDKPGLYNMAKIRRQYPELNYIYIPKTYKCKDISDFYKTYGKRKTLDIIKQYVLWLKERI